MTALTSRRVNTADSRENPDSIENEASGDDPAMFFSDSLGTVGAMSRQTLISVVSDDGFVTAVPLVDWDDSVRGLNNLQNSEVPHLARETHAPEIFAENGTHDRTVDLWSIGYIIHSNREFADTMLSTLKDGLMTEASRRMTITEALRRLEVQT